MAIHRCEYRVIFGDTDGMGIVYYANYLRIFEMARSEFFRDLIRLPLEMIRDDMYPVAVKVFVHYHSPAVYDDLLTVTSWIPAGKIKQATFRFEYVISVKESGRRIVSGYTEHAMTSREGKLKRMPRDFLQILAGAADPHHSLDGTIP